MYTLGNAFWMTGAAFELGAEAADTRFGRLGNDRGADVMSVINVLTKECALMLWTLAFWTFTKMNWVSSREVPKILFA